MMSAFGKNDIADTAKPNQIQTKSYLEAIKTPIMVYIDK